MNRDEILAKSREENKAQDLYEMEMDIKAGHLCALVALALATIFFVTQSVVGGGFNFGLFALVLSYGAVRCIFRAVTLRRKLDVFFGIIYTFALLALSVAHMARLIGAAA